MTVDYRLKEVNKGNKSVYIKCKLIEIEFFINIFFKEHGSKSALRRNSTHPWNCPIVIENS
jgi:hypothetical protein